MTRYPYGGEAAHTLSGNNEAEYYSDSSAGENPFSVSNGVLAIAATPAAPHSNPYNLPYDSGVITTDTSFSQTYGYFEVNAQLPSEQGMWPAFWLLPASNNYTSELDVFEAINHQPTTIYSTVHGTTNGSWGSNSQAFTVPDMTSGLHTYGVDWEPTTTTFYVDGVKTGSAPTPSSMNDPMFMLLNLAVGGAGSWPGAPDASTKFPATMQINWVHAYATAGTTYVGGRAAVPSATPPPVVTVGAGSSVLALAVSEDAWIGDAQFTVSVDGVQIGGTQTTIASHAAGATQMFDIRGNFAPGAHSVSVDFVNDAWGGSAQTDRNLYVGSATLDGAAIPDANLALTRGGSQGFGFIMSAPATLPTIGSGASVLALTLSEDAWRGDAQFTVSVDGVQIGGTQTATAAHAAGATQTLELRGDFAPGLHSVSVDFVNDAWGGSAQTDRNLYVGGATLDGAAVAGASLALLQGGSRSFDFMTPGLPAPTPAPTLTIGSGASVLALTLSEDAWNGDAQFTVSVDGVQVGGTQTATAAHAAGATQTLELRGDFTPGAHSVSVDFVNDAWGGSAQTDRNLYVGGATLDGAAVPDATLALMKGGSQGFGFTAPGALAAAAGVGADTIVLSVAEDAWRGDAQFTINVDGTPVGGTMTAIASHAAGASQTVTLRGNWGTGAHVVGVSFLNDAYGGTAATDRNLYLNSLSYDGVAVPSSTVAMMWEGTYRFAVPDAGVLPAVAGVQDLPATSHPFALLGQHG